MWRETLKGMYIGETQKNAEYVMNRRKRFKINLLCLPWSIQVSFITITTEGSSNSIRYVMLPYLMLTSHRNVNFLINRLKGDIPWGVENLK